MAVDDYGIEVLKKAATPLTAGSKAEYLLRTKSFGAYLFEVTQGNVPGQSLFRKFGVNFDVDTAASPEAIWTVGTGARPTYLTSAQTVDVSSDDPNDTVGGSGARTIEISGLGVDYAAGTFPAFLTETISLDGTNAVTTSANFLRVFRGEVLTAGSSVENEGTISVVKGMNTLADIIPETNQTLMNIWTVPAGETAYLVNIFASVIPKDQAIGIKEGHFSLVARKPGGVFQTKIELGLNSRGTLLDRSYEGQLKFEEKTDIETLFHTHQNNTKVTAEMIFLRIQNG